MTGLTKTWLHRQDVGCRYSFKGVLIMVILCHPLQGLNIVATILGPNLVEYFYHQVVRRKGEVDKFEVLNFIGSRGRGSEDHSVKAIRASLSVALARVVLGLLIPVTDDLGVVGQTVTSKMADITVVECSLRIAIVISGHMLWNSNGPEILLNFVLCEVLHYVERGFERNQR